MSATVVHCKRHAFDVYIGRPSKWGNPFVIGRDGTREEVIAKYREYLKTRPDLIDAICELSNKRLGCFCYPEKCHGDVLAELANGPRFCTLSDIRMSGLSEEEKAIEEDRFMEKD